ncbi:MAG: CapA family protein [Gammaproteobacteria bacterium]|nr:MAG: CapA family protein [Gammaproteobacteria bacterium]
MVGIKTVNRVNTKQTQILQLVITALVLVTLSACSTTGRITQTTPGKKAEPKWRELRITAVGDLMLDASARETVDEEGYDYPFALTKKYFDKADIVFANLEGPLTDGGKRDRKKRFVFRSPPNKVALALKRAGIDIVSLANNHSLDYGAEGLFDTTFALDRQNILYVGAGKNIKAARSFKVINANGHDVAFLAYNLTHPHYFWARRRRPGTAFGHERFIRRDVKEAKQHADIVAVSFHWGREVQTRLRPYQPWLSRIAIDSGASLVLGHHPHILQGVEVYKGGLIIYSLGNYAFGSFSKRTTRSAVAQITFRENKFYKLRMIPLNVDNTEVLFQPTPLKGKAADKVVSTLQTLSRPLGTNFVNNNGVAELIIPVKNEAVASQNKTD